MTNQEYRDIMLGHLTEAEQQVEQLATTPVTVCSIVELCDIDYQQVIVSEQEAINDYYYGSIL